MTTWVNCQARGKCVRLRGFQIFDSKKRNRKTRLRLAALRFVAIPSLLQRRFHFHSRFPITFVPYFSCFCTRRCSVLFQRVVRAFLVGRMGIGIVSERKEEEEQASKRSLALLLILLLNFYSRCTINIEPHPRIAKPAMATSEVVARRPSPVRAPTLSRLHLLLTLLQPAVLRFNSIWLPPRDRRNNSHLRNNRRK